MTSKIVTYRGDRIIALNDIMLDAVAYFGYPKTKNFRCMMPQNTVLRSKYDFYDFTEQLIFKPDKYEEFERKHIPIDIIENELFFSYELLVQREHASTFSHIYCMIERQFEMPMIISFGYFEKYRMSRKNTFTIGDKLKLSGGYDYCQWLCGRDHYIGTVIDYINRNNNTYIIVKVENMIKFEDKVGDILVLNLRYEGANWSGFGDGDERIGIGLCSNISEAKGMKECKYIESHAQYEIL